MAFYDEDLQHIWLGKRSQNDHISREMIDIFREIINKCPKMIDIFWEMNDIRLEMNDKLKWLPR